MNELIQVVLAICAIVIAICAIICATHLAAIDEYANRVRELINYDVRVRHKLNEKKEDADHKS